MKLLRVLHQAQQEHAVDLVASFCGAHSVPKGMTADEAATAIVEQQLPELARLRALGEISPTLVDVFMEKGVFDAAQTERILKAGRYRVSAVDGYSARLKKSTPTFLLPTLCVLAHPSSALGLEHNFHGDEINYTGSGELAGQLRSLAVSHLEKISPEGETDRQRQRHSAQIDRQAGRQIDSHTDKSTGVWPAGSSPVRQAFGRLRCVLRSRCCSPPPPTFCGWSSPPRVR